MLGFAMPATAQERTAAGALDTQMTWTALKNLVDATSVKVDAVNARVDQGVVCGKKQMYYAPGANGADNDGCLGNTNIVNIINCGKEGKVYNGTACIQTSSSSSSESSKSMSWSLSSTIGTNTFSFADAWNMVTNWPHANPTMTALRGRFSSYSACGMVPSGRSCDKSAICIIESVKNVQKGGDRYEKAHSSAIYECR